MKNLLLISTLFVFFACESGSNEKGEFAFDAEFEDLVEIPATHQGPPPEEDPNDAITQKLVKTGGIDFQSRDVAKDYEKIRALLPKYKAYIENENQSKSAGRNTYSLTIRVPSIDYDTLYTSLASMGMGLEHKYSNVEDVTAHYYDLQTRISNKKVLEQRYVNLLKKASDIKDILVIERNINEVRTDIEQLQAQFNYLSKQVSLSTINISFYELLPYSYETSKRRGFGARILQALDNGWEAFLSFLVVATSLWPFLILLVVVIFLYKRLVRNRGENGK